MIKNLTGHNIRIFTQDKKWTDVPPTEWVRIQLTQQNEKVWEIDWVDILKQSYSIPEKTLNFFAPVEDWVIYIVSSIVAMVTKRPDFYVVGSTIKWPDRRSVLGCNGICRNPYI